MNQLSINSPIMKNQTSEMTIDIFNAFELSIEEMTYVRGGESDPIIKTTVPPVKL